MTKDHKPGVDPSSSSFVQHLQGEGDDTVSPSVPKETKKTRALFLRARWIGLLGILAALFGYYGYGLIVPFHSNFRQNPAANFDGPPLMERLSVLEKRLDRQDYLSFLFIDLEDKFQNGQPVGPGAEKILSHLPLTSPLREPLGVLRSFGDGAIVSVAVLSRRIKDAFNPPSTEMVSHEPVQTESNIDFDFSDLSKNVQSFLDKNLKITETKPHGTALDAPPASGGIHDLLAALQRGDYGAADEYLAALPDDFRERLGVDFHRHLKGHIAVAKIRRLGAYGFFSKGEGQ